MSRPDIALLTIGAFGFDEEGFFDALLRAEVDTFCDIRQRRGVRGAKFAFVNSKRLQFRLIELGIRYVHLKALAPTEHVRNTQKRADASTKVAKRQRVSLHPEFVAAYRAQCLDNTTPNAILDLLPSDSRRVVLFCVEDAPSACHRSLAADWLSSHTARGIEHIRPDR